MFHDLDGGKIFSVVERGGLLLALADVLLADAGQIDVHKHAVVILIRFAMSAHVFFSPYRELLQPQGAAREGGDVLP